MGDKPTATEPRARCARCARPQRVCICDALTPLETTTRVVVLQHPREARVGIGTARLLSVALPSCTVERALVLGEAHPTRRAIEEAGAHAALLFPGEDVPSLSEAPRDRPATLVVLDGTWSTAATLLKRNPWLARVPRYRLPEGLPSEYRIRREPDEAFVSTLEATGRALAVLEPGGFDVDALLAPFRAMVSTQQRFARDVGASRHVQRPRERKPLQARLPKALFAEASRVVCLEGEANAWPRSVGGEVFPPDEIIHVTALRLDGSPLFDEMARPSHPPSPSTPTHVRLSREAIVAAPPRSALLAHLTAYLRPDDVLVTWGSYALRVLAAEAIALPASRIDLRRQLTLAANQRSGAITDVLARRGLEEGPARGRGRAGARLAALVTLLEALREDAVIAGTY